MAGGPLSNGFPDKKEVLGCPRVFRSKAIPPILALPTSKKETGLPSLVVPIQAYTLPTREANEILKVRNPP